MGIEQHFILIIGALIIVFMTNTFFNLLPKKWPKSGFLGIDLGAFSYVCVRCNPSNQVKMTSLAKMLRNQYKCDSCGSRYTPICPECGISNPKKRTFPQLLWGGWTCGNCGSIWNKNAIKIGKST